MQHLHDIFAANRRGQAVGIYSVCSAHSLVLKAAMLKAKADNSLLLVESTANQVNQFGGYTGMQPADFIDFVHTLAAQTGLDRQRLIFGGDHLGPVCWTDQPAEQALQLCETLIRTYVQAGFCKIHLDTSMPCADDPAVLNDEIIAARAARLCAVAEQESSRLDRRLSYVIGTEVPAPGGVNALEHHLAPTPVDNVLHTLKAHQQAFAAAGLNEQTWDKVVAVVVQPGVEFDNTQVHDFSADQAARLSGAIHQVPNLVYEAHSTDYQLPEALAALVKGHFAILKVGPALTFALREGLFALSHIEDALIEETRRSGLRRLCEAELAQQPKYWQKFYPDVQNQPWLRFFSYSDRIRYYWNQPGLAAAVEKLLGNLSQIAIPLPLLSQYMPVQYQAVRRKKLAPQGEALLLDKLTDVLGDYARACQPLDTLGSQLR
ncbi:D-tagatose-bisphosphate aldolase, class II, non-catalytic subunit [Bowmanella dokdonensis]|uniref:D-tagatose-bisphosphate aldolase, class II, non-catalytic subunit n=1 Tax=Bowmanella dokdonensis TaxID=751969 RepID=A0A939DS10_9ALTE|nr:D-tagatose-bisphosphate aldolase, class II, non-catalytic subunit [Bowmanella dokdonensis]MBN7827618.1 D-tagatose-bisphosphate aldolase, class II, non-catalytic subunit [Bowmanella dokdonensis]